MNTALQVAHAASDLSFYSDLALNEAQEKRALRRSLGIALGIHFGLLLITFPQLQSSQLPSPPAKNRVLVLTTPRFKPPIVTSTEVQPRERRRLVPVPDLTPDEPEPQILEVAFDPTDFVSIDAVINIPDAPPAEKAAEPEPLVLDVGAAVKPPVRLYAPQPRYPEVARRARIQGSVILKLLINPQGTVSDLEVVKGMGFNLTEEAVKAVEQWRFEPPTTASGRPVSLRYLLTVQFELQN
jgi:periplasmic protein TonB